ncbi:hypothetical protein D3C80_1078350 [compost metagenome]
MYVHVIVELLRKRKSDYIRFGTIHSLKILIEIIYPIIFDGNLFVRGDKTNVLTDEKA